MKVGDRVRIKDHPSRPEGKIIKKQDVAWTWGANIIWYTVEFDDKSLIPPTQKYTEERLELIEALPIGEASTEPKCECGQSDDIWVKHSYYCKLYRK